MVDSAATAAVTGSPMDAGACARAMQPLLDAATGASVLMDATRTVLAFNAAAQGAARQVMEKEMRAGEPMEAYTAPDAVEAMHANVAGALAGRRVETQRAQRYPNGTVRTWALAYSPVFLPGGGTLVLLTAREVTPPDEVQARLHLFERALNASSLGYTIAKATGDRALVFVNPAFEALTGYTAAEVLGQNCRFMSGNDRDQPGLDVLRAGMREGRTVRAVVRNYRKDGTLFHNEVTLAPLHDEQGRLEYFLGLQHDVTALRDAESRLHAASRLVSAGALAAGVAHDVNNFLYITQLNLDLLSESGDATAREAHAELVPIHDRLRGVLQRLLAVARGGQGPQASHMDVTAWLAGSRRLLGTLVGAGIRVDLQVPAEPAVVAAPSVTLDQVLVNLVLNARHAMRDHGTLEIRVLRRDLPRAVVVEVTDSGPGVPEERQAEVFLPFRSSRTDEGGTGLGLATSRRLLREFGGDLELHSPPGKGATFRLVLPTAP